MSFSYRRERMLNEAVYRHKRLSNSTPFPLPQDHQSSDSSDEDQPDNHTHFTRDHTPMLNRDKGATVENGTPRSSRRKFFRRKRRSSTKESSLPKDSPGFLKRITNTKMLTRRQSLPPLQSLTPSPPPHASHTSTPTSDSLQSSKPSFNLDLQANENADHKLDTSALSPGGTLSPGVAELLERVRLPSHRRTGSNGSAKLTRRRGSSGSCGSHRNVTPPSLSPVKRMSSHSNCPLPSAASTSHRASNHSVPFLESSGSGVTYSKLGMSDSGSDENETGTHSSAAAGNITSSTVDDTLSNSVPRTRYPSTPQRLNSESYRSHHNEQEYPHESRRSLKDVYSNESSADTRATDGGHDADSESNDEDDENPLDQFSELEPVETNESNIESPILESDDLSSTSDLLNRMTTKSSPIPEPVTNLDRMGIGIELQHPLSPEVLVQDRTLSQTVPQYPNTAVTHKLDVDSISSTIPSQTTMSLLQTSSQSHSSTRKPVATLISQFEGSETSSAQVSNVRKQTDSLQATSDIARSHLILSNDCTSNDISILSHDARSMHVSENARKGGSTMLEIPFHIRRPTKPFVPTTGTGSYSPKLIEEALRESES